MMRGPSIIRAAVIFCGLFLIAWAGFASGQIIINEIGAYESSGYEWIEIWNSGNDPVDLTGWKFLEDRTNHSLLASSTDSMLAPDEYAAICQDEYKFLSHYPAFSGSIFDSSWGSLNESGEEIGLKDGEGNTTTLFTYSAASNFSLERINPYAASDDASNWRQHPASNTLGVINSCFSTNTAATASTTTSTPSEPAATSTYDPSLWLAVKINEFVANPGSGNEWVELYQATTGSLDLSGSVICDSRETSCKPVTGTIGGFSFLQVDLFSDAFLNNDGDSVIFKDASGTIFDRVDYDSSHAPGEGRSLARLFDGADSGSINDWAITTSLTPGAPNIIIAPEPAHSSGGGSVGRIPETVEEEAVEVTSSAYFGTSVLLNEIFPNPSGSDSEGEFIELINSSTGAIDLAGWKLADSVRGFSLSGTISPGQIIFWERPKTNIALNNSTAEEVKLISPDGKTADIVKYAGAREGESYARDKAGGWRWTVEPTPGEENIFSITEAGGIVWKITAPSSGGPGEMLVFDAEDSADERGGLISFFWDFGDGAGFAGGEVLHAYSATGTFGISVFATSTAGSSAVKKMKITIGDLLSLGGTGIQISEILSNPEGDETREFLEIANFGLLAVDLSGWRMKSGSKAYTFPDNTLIGPGAFLAFYRRVTGLILNNQGSQIALLNRDGALVDLVKIGAAKEGVSYAFLDNEWQWTVEPTPGGPNVKNFAAEKTGEQAATAKSSAIHKKMSIAEARAAEAGVAVIVRGSVTALPGNFGVQYFYIGDGSSGIQVYNYKKDFPELDIGDYVEVRGEISEAQGVKRIKTKDRSAVDILETEKILAPAAFDIGLIGEEDYGRLASVKGEITEAKSNYLYLDNGAGEIKVYFKSGAKIKKQLLQEGGRAGVVGIVEAARGEIELWPRGQADISVSSSIQEVAGEKIGADKKSGEVPLLYLLAGGLAAVFMGFLARAKGAVIINLLKGFFK